MRALSTEVDQLREAMRSQRANGIAVGLLAERYSCGTDAAWALLRRISSHTNVKVRVIARVLVDASDGRTLDEDRPMLRFLERELASGRTDPSAG